MSEPRTTTRGRGRKSGSKSNGESPSPGDSETTVSGAGPYHLEGESLQGEWDRDELISEYRLARISREASILGRKEVLTGKAKFGIFGDGKELAQLAMARSFRPGDTRSGYYRDQTLMFATGMSSVREFFAQLYANPDIDAEPASGGRSMNGHFSIRQLDESGQWLPQTDRPNTSADVSPTGSQMPRLVGLAYASRLYRELDELKEMVEFSRNGEEIAYGTIGNASCAEGMFFEAVNAIGVLKSPAIISVWDDGYGISVPNEFQITKGSVSTVLSGFQRKQGDSTGYDIYVVRGWDFPALVEAYRRASENARRDHIPALVHVVEVTQPQGHSTSGSHERYKSPERLKWEEEFDPISRFRSWLIENEYASEQELDDIDSDAADLVRQEQQAAWNDYIEPIDTLVETTADLLEAVAARAPGQTDDLKDLVESLRKKPGSPYRLDISVALHRALLLLRSAPEDMRAPLIEMKRDFEARNRRRFSSHLFSESAESALKVDPVPLRYSQKPERLKGFEVINACFDAALARDPRIIAFGEDVGQLGDVDQGFAGLQSKYGPLRVSDTGIREVTIVGQAIGMAMRGLRPIAEIQYLDYLLYALQLMSDDLATLQYRTRGGQKAPAIIRTRGHRLEGIWHSGSPMAGILNLVRGMHVLVPRDFTRAAGFYNTILASDEPALIVEVLSGYRLREEMPENIDEYRLELGRPEVLRSGDDLTIVTYGACCRVAMDGAALLEKVGISTEVIDVQSLLPFDLNGRILDSLKKTNRIIFLDEDVPGGTTAYMMQKVLEEQNGYRWLDSDPRTLSAAEHRPAYGSDGSYWSKPFPEHVFEAAYEMMNEADPKKYPLYYRQDD